MLPNKNFFKNKIKFNIFPLTKSKGCLLIFYNKEPFQTLAYQFLPNNLKEEIKKNFKKINKLDFYLNFNSYQDYCLIKTDKEKIKSIKDFSRWLRKIYKFLKENKIESFSIYLNDLFSNEIDKEKSLELIVINFILADFNFAKFYKTNQNDYHHLNINFYIESKFLSNFKKVIDRSIIIGEEINRARFLSNLPGGDLTPSIMVDFIKEISKETDLKLKILSEKELKKLGAGGILGVARGSREKPYLVILENKNKGKEIHLIGKGITFDTGGLHLKPAEHINEMHLDMSGAASVICASSLFKKLNMNINFTTLVPLAENMISGESYRPGDILKTISGKTIEVGSPDAEGRIILADAIDCAKKFYKPNLIITVATLTGASMVALGSRASALFTNNKKIQDLFLEISEKTWESLWPLPLWEEYKKEIEAPFADLFNIGKTRWGGAIHGALFLWEFAKPVNFIHLDIAPRMTAIEDDYLSKGSLGFGVYLLKEFAQNIHYFNEVI
jgi:leucyl aminopeptidase